MRAVSRSEGLEIIHVNILTLHRFLDDGPFLGLLLCEVP